MQICLRALLALSASGIATAAEFQHPLNPNVSPDVAAFDPAFDAFVEATLQEWHVPGLSIAVIDNGSIVSNKGYGFANLPDRNATAETQYMTGSTTKAFTAAAAALLVHDNHNYPEVQWISPISDFIGQDFTLENDYATLHTTLEDAILHRTGMPRHDLVHGQPNDTPADVVRKLKHLPLVSEPRQAFLYCPLMYGAVTHLLETVTATSLAKLLYDRIWKPLGMLSTTFDISTSSPDLARGYWWYESESRYVPEYYDNVSSISGSGAIISTVNDYALWINTLLESAADDDTNPNRESSCPLSKEIIRDLFTSRIISDDWFSEYQPILYALGWQVVTIRGETLITHGGGETGFGTTVYMLPAHDFGVVTMANTMISGAVAGTIIANSLLLEKLGWDADDDDKRSASATHKNHLRPKPPTLKPHPNPFPTLHRSKACADDIPLPWPLERLAGLYSHPAYGDITLTLTPLQSTTSHEQILEGVFYPRTWPLKIQLTHISGALFEVKFFEPHGLGNVRTGEGIVWEDLSEEGDDNRAVFEAGAVGHGIERVGIEIDKDLVETATRMGGEEWRRGMIWFEKV